MHPGNIFADTGTGAHAYWMGKRGHSTERTPKEMLEWLFVKERTKYYRRGRLNILQLTRDMHEALGESAPSQSTLHRWYAGITKTPDDATVAALSQFTNTPAALIRGEVYFSAAETWGMEITAGESRVLRALQELKDDQRKAIYEQIRAMLPDDKKNLVPRLPEPNVIRFQRPSGKDST